jgi:hypothetical protein
MVVLLGLYGLWGGIAFRLGFDLHGGGGCGCWGRERFLGGGGGGGGFGGLCGGGGGFGLGLLFAVFLVFFGLVGFGWFVFLGV